MEKKLDIKNKAEIEKLGISKFNALCKESVFEYVKIWTEASKVIIHNRSRFWYVCRVIQQLLLASWHEDVIVLARPYRKGRSPKPVPRQTYQKILNFTGQKLMK